MYFFAFHFSRLFVGSICSNARQVIVEIYIYQVHTNENLKIFCYYSLIRIGKPRSKIINGSNVRIGELKYQAQLVYKVNSEHFCGGVLISNRFVLTASHCLEDEEEQDIQVVLGSISINGNKGLRRAVEEIIMHPEYDSETRANDIALILVSVQNYTHNIEECQIFNFHKKNKLYQSIKFFRWFKKLHFPTPFPQQSYQVEMKKIFEESLLDGASSPRKMASMVISAKIPKH